jgi:G patch domain-containing protein 1
MAMYSISLLQRGSILGETPLPAAPRSVFDFMSQKDRERLQRAAGSLASGDAAASSAGPAPATSMPPPAPETVHIPPTPPPTAKAALLGFQPFISDPARHARYTTYLRSQSAADGSAPTLALAPGQTIAAFNREAAEFAQAAAVFKPLSGAMAGRFTTAAVVESTANAHGGLYTPSFDKEEPKAEEVQKEEEKEEDPKTHAARMGMFGPLTRTAVRWAPVKLLCKRFGVKDPHPEADAAPETAAFPSAAAGSSSAGTDAAAIPEEQLAIEGPPTHASEDAKPSGPRDLANIGLGEDAYQAQEVLTYERPERDVFKAIFASDDEDSDEEEPAEEPDADVPVPAPAQSAGAVTPAAAPSALLPAAPASVSTAVVSALPAAGSEKLDLSTFKPTFVPRVERDARKTEGKAPAKDKERKKKNDKTLVSFDTEDGEDIALGAPRPKKRKDKGKEREKDVEKGREKKKRRKEGEPVDQEDEWVEKAPSEAVKQMQIAGSIPSAIPASRSEAVIKGRMKAADFM